MVVTGLALLAAALGAAVAQLPAVACSALVRRDAPRSPAVQLVLAGARSVLVLGVGVATTAAVTMLAVPGWTWTGAVAVVAVGMVPLAAAPITAAPLLGAPLRIGLLAWCAGRVLPGLGGSAPALLALLAGSAAAVAVCALLGPRRLTEVIGQTIHDTVSALVAVPIVVAVGVVPLLISLPLAPWELWWSCRPGRSAGPRPPGRTGPAELFVVYLDGVGKTGRAPTRVARDLVVTLGAALPGARFVTDVLPYSPLQLPLTQRPGSGRVWRWLRRRAFPMLVGHNIVQALVAGDARYQQAYGVVLARAMVESLWRAGHRPGDRVVVLGYSGGALIGVAAADPLADLLDGPASASGPASGPASALVVVSVGGYLDGRRMSRRVTVHHLTGSADRLERLGRAMFPARWVVVRRSAWNRALAQGRVVRHPVADSRHIGSRGYLATSKNAAGASNLARTVAVIARLLQPDLQR